MFKRRLVEELSSPICISLDYRNLKGRRVSFLSLREPEITVSAGSSNNGWKSCWSGHLWHWRRTKGCEGGGCTHFCKGLWSNARSIKKTTQDWKILLHLLPLLKQRRTDRRVSVLPPRVEWSMRRGCKLYLVLGFVPQLHISYFKFRMWALKTRIFYSLVWVWKT